MSAELSSDRQKRQLDPHGAQSIHFIGSGGQTVATQQSLDTLDLGQPDGDTRALLIVHGRGASAEGILGLGLDLAAASGQGRFVHLAPQAASGSWYPGSFLEPHEHNQPWLSSALARLEACSNRLEELGIEADRQVLVGFSQGACLACEFLYRSQRSYAGLLAFTGGVLGPLGTIYEAPTDSRLGTRVLLSSGDPDPHVPFARVQETAQLFEQMGASVEVDRYPGRPHTIVAAEIERAARLLA